MAEPIFVGETRTVPTPEILLRVTELMVVAFVTIVPMLITVVDSGTVVAEIS